MVRATDRKNIGSSEPDGVPPARVSPRGPRIRKATPSPQADQLRDCARRMEVEKTRAPSGIGRFYEGPDPGHC